MKPPTLSVTWRVRVLNGLLSATVLVTLVVAAQARIRTVLYESVDSSLREQASGIAFDPFHGMHRPPNDGDPEGDPFGPPRAPNPQAPGQRMPGRQMPWQGRPEEGRDPRRGRPGEPPPIRFGAIALRPARVLDVQQDGGPRPWSEAGFTNAQQNREDLREETDNTGERLRVFSVLVPPRDNHPALVVQTAASLTPTDAVLREIQTALYSLLLPLAVGVGVTGAFLTNFALAPVRRLTAAVSRIQETNLAERLPAPGGGDTFDQLVTLLNALLARLDAAFARQKRFTGNASHELRTPLAVIKSATSLLLENPETLSPLQERALRRADQSADRANQLIADLLLLARTENDTMAVRYVRSSINAIVAEVFAEIETTHPKPHATLQAQLPESLEVSTDPAHLRRLLINLLTNALRHTPATGTVSVIARLDTANWELRVRDTGEGIAPGELARLGEPFYRPDASRAREHGGTGLGLALCKGIVTAMQGTFQIESAVGIGTTVIVRLPIPSHADH